MNPDSRRGIIPRDAGAAWLPAIRERKDNWTFIQVYSYNRSERYGVVTPRRQ